ncbi:MAG: ABC transporter ATP-binding protein [Nitrospirae bacterium]|nr:ABC transporter ATP-binding protein [Nitrospirota bacterium]
MYKTLSALVAGLPKRRRLQLLILLGVIVSGAIAEVISLGAIFPFLAILADPENALKKPLVAQIVNILGLGNSTDLRWQLTLLFSTTAVVSGLVRFVMIYVTAKINYGIGHELGAEVYRRTLYQPYELHVARNSSETLGGLNKVDDVVWVVFVLLNLTSALIMASFILTAILMINPVLATSTLLCFGTFYAVVSTITRKKLSNNSQVISHAHNKRVQSVQEGLGGIRDVLLDNTQIIFASRFIQTDWPMRQAQASNNIIGPSPRFAVEALSMVLIAVLAYKLTASSGGLATAIPTLGSLALGAQRLMPLLQQTYQGWVYVSGNRQVLNDVVELLQQPVAIETQMRLEPLPFKRQIRLDNVSFRYQQHLPLVLDGLNLVITRGERIGFFGTTGSGKSTVMDIIMGLLQPSQGQIIVDDTPLTGASRLAWQSNIAHVPQAIFLADASFAENIAFGVLLEQIDMERVRQAAKQAQIGDFIEETQLAYQTMVGERGVRLSGGQRQRIGIARALYKQSTVLVFDEATSALDSETESAVMTSIERLGRELTVLIIAHRLTTLRGCDRIYRLDKGQLVSSGTYHELIATNLQNIDRSILNAG